MNVSECMKRNVVTLPDTATIGEAAALFAARHIGMLPVLDPAGRLVGTLQLRDLLALVMPDFVRPVEDFDFVHDFGALETQRPTPEVLARPVREVMQTPISVNESCGLLRAFSTLRHRDLHDLPVVTAADRLVGIASRVDIGTALLSNWHTSRPEAV
jgi:CBS-domain-containing membrane protein